MKPYLTVLEGKWFQDKHVTVRDLFSPLFSVWGESSADASYHYEQFTNGPAFVDAIKFAFRRNHAATIYVAAHGSQRAIYGFHDEGIPREVIRNALNPNIS